VTIWDAETGTELMTLHDGQPDVWSIAVAPDGRYVAGGDQDGIVRMWEAATSVD